MSCTVSFSLLSPVYESSGVRSFGSSLFDQANKIGMVAERLLVLPSTTFLSPQLPSSQAVAAPGAAEMFLDPPMRHFDASTLHDYVNMGAAGHWR